MLWIDNLVLEAKCKWRLQSPNFDSIIKIILISFSLPVYKTEKCLNTSSVFKTEMGYTFKPVYWKKLRNDELWVIKIIYL